MGISSSYKFLAKQKSLARYAGKWIAVVDKKIFAGKTLKEVYAKAKKYAPEKEPLLGRVPEKGKYIMA